LPTPQRIMPQRNDHCPRERNGADPFFIKCCFSSRVNRKIPFQLSNNP